MTRIAFLAGAAALLLSPLSAIAADDHAVVAAPDTLKWAPGPPGYPKGAEFAIITGSPGQEGPFVLRLKAPAGYKVPPHTHPADENATVLSGSVNFGTGEKVDAAKETAVKPGGYFKASKGMAHYASFTEPTIIQVHGVGPTGISYINPADDPRKSN
jgi:quercetin dioxygenase-like cupin family protein